MANQHMQDSGNKSERSTEYVPIQNIQFSLDLIFEIETHDG